MKIEIERNKYWYCYKNTFELNYTQQQYDYVYKNLDFDKLDKDWFIYFNDCKVEKWFRKKYTNHMFLETIYKESQDGYEWLKENWGNGVFKLPFEYLDKQELKTIVNRIFNIGLKRGVNNESQIKRYYFK